MSLISFLYLFVTGALLSGLLFFIAAAPSLDKTPAAPILAYNDVKGMAVESNGLLYTVNFDRQNRIVAAINKNEQPPVGEICTGTVDKLVIYRFNAPDWVINIKTP